MEHKRGEETKILKRGQAVLKGAGTPLRTMSSLYLVHILYEFIFIIYIYKEKKQTGTKF